jgi:hypothetical protein
MSKPRQRVVTRDLQREIDTIRVRIGKLKDERDSLVDADVPQDEALQRLDDWIATERDRYRSGSIGAFIARDQGQVAPMIHPTVSGGNTVSFGNVQSALVWIAPDLVRAALAAEIENHYRTRGDAGVADDDREQRLAELDDELLELETDEERMICQAEAAGLTVLRRGDADPRAIVAACEC